MPKFRKKPVVIEAVQWNGNNRSDITAFCSIAKWEQTPFEGERSEPPVLVIPTLEGDHRAVPGDWIIRGVKGEFYPCKPDIFEQTYDIFVEA